VKLMAAVIAAMLIAGTAQAALACKEEIRAPEASVCITRDPVAYLGLDNTASTVAVPMRVVWHLWTTGERRTKDFYLAPGEEKLKQIRVHGGHKTLSVIDLGTRDVLLRVVVGDAKQASCP
jgi:hypothetical protein